MVKSLKHHQSLYEWQSSPTPQQFKNDTSSKPQSKNNTSSLYHSKKNMSSPHHTTNDISLPHHSKNDQQRKQTPCRLLPGMFASNILSLFTCFQIRCCFTWIKLALVWRSIYIHHTLTAMCTLHFGAPHFEGCHSPVSGVVFPQHRWLWCQCHWSCYFTWSSFSYWARRDLKVDDGQVLPTHLLTPIVTLLDFQMEGYRASSEAD